MKIIAKIIVSAFLLLPVQRASAQAEEITQLVLNIQKLNQMRQVLSQIKQAYDILVGGYNTIIGISKGNYNIHRTHLNGLLNVSPTVRNYARVADIIQYQYQLAGEYKRAYERFSSGGNFRADELAYMSQVYNNLLKQSMRNLDELTTVLTAGKTRMSDDERLQIIDRVYVEMGDKLTFLRQFNASTEVLRRNRLKEQNDVRTIEHIYGFQQ